MKESLKPGWQSTEWWTLLSAQVLAILALVGVIPQADVGTLQDAASKAFASLGIIVAQAIVVIHYVHSRTALKTAGLDANPSPSPTTSPSKE